MSTRSNIFAETEKGTLGVYVHCDGYPDGNWGKLATLNRLVAKHGLAKTVATLLATPAGWSTFDGSPGEELPSGYDDGRFELVPGFGVRYTLDELDHGGETYVQGNTEYEKPEGKISFDIEYVYLITADGHLKWAEHADTWNELAWQDAGPLEPSSPNSSEELFLDEIGFSVN